MPPRSGAPYDLDLVMTAHVESQKQKVHKEILFRASKNPPKIPLRGEAATRRPLRGGVHTDVLDASLPSPPARAPAQAYPQMLGNR